MQIFTDNNFPQSKSPFSFSENSMSDRMPLSNEFWTLDVFTRERFRGNPLAVVFEDKASEYRPEEKQKVAREFNLSETVILNTQTDREDDVPAWSLTILTPAAELPFAGHPLIGTACALALRGDVADKGAFTTLAGNVQFSVECSRDRTLFPMARAEVRVPFSIHEHDQTFSDPVLPKIQPESYSNALKKRERNGHPVFSITKGMTYVLIDLDSLESLNSETERPYPEASPTLDEDWSPSFVGFYFYYKKPIYFESDPIELHTRMFEPDLGEDPVTGSAACALSAFLALEAFAEGQSQRKFEFHLTQGEEMRRKGTIKVIVELSEEGQVSSITLKGEAIKVMSGFIERG